MKKILAAIALLSLTSHSITICNFRAFPIDEIVKIQNAGVLGGDQQVRSTYVGETLRLPGESPDLISTVFFPCGILSLFGIAVFVEGLADAHTYYYDASLKPVDKGNKVLGGFIKSLFGVALTVPLGYLVNSMISNLK